MAILSAYRRAVAGCTVSVEAIGCRLEERLEPEQLAFCVEDGASAPADMRLRVFVGGAPPRPDRPPIFVTPAWELWSRDGGGYLVSLLRGQGLANPVVVSDALTSDVSFHGIEPWSRDGGGMPVFLDPLVMPLDQLLFMHHLAHREGFILHSAGIELDGIGVAMPGVSGAGKSTLSGLVAAALPEARLLSDERLVVRRDGEKFMAWGTPWMGTARVARNEQAPLGALVFPARGVAHRITDLPPRSAMRRMLGVASCPLWDEDRAGAVLATLEALVARVPAFELQFLPEPGVGQFLRDFLARTVRVT